MIQNAHRTVGLKCLDEHTSPDGHVQRSVDVQTLEWLGKPKILRNEGNRCTQPTTANREKQYKVSHILQHCKPTRKYKTLELLSHWRGNVRAAPRPQTLGGAPKRAPRSSTLIEPPQTRPVVGPRSSSTVETPGGAPSSPEQSGSRAQDLHPQTVTILHKLTKAITKRVSFMSWNDDVLSARCAALVPDFFGVFIWIHYP